MARLGKYRCSINCRPGTVRGPDRGTALAWSPVHTGGLGLACDTRLGPVGTGFPTPDALRRSTVALEQDASCRAIDEAVVARRLPRPRGGPGRTVALRRGTPLRHPVRGLAAEEPQPRPATM
ncbi:hypothetical protein ACFXP3_08815 [Streptomyces sp. NPDC059096]|uniref:hypothetical protein n=1 Tax=Streptomyces sp. NPDC059096 TaxID=3346727 RepID=UPI0036892037